MAQPVGVEQSEGEGTTSASVVAAVARELGTDPATLEPLYNAIEPDALDDLFDDEGLGTSRSPARVEFTYCGCDVVITGDGRVEASAVE